jgi:hypothetical protein
VQRKRNGSDIGDDDEDDNDVPGESSYSMHNNNAANTHGLKEVRVGGQDDVDYEEVA